MELFGGEEELVGGEEDEVDCEDVNEVDREDVDEVDHEDVDDVDELTDCDEVDVASPVPTHNARSASPVRLANRPASQLEPSQGFQACRSASVRLLESLKIRESVMVEQVI